MARLDDARAILDAHLLCHLCRDVGFSRKSWARRIMWSDSMNTSQGFMMFFAKVMAAYVQYSGSSSEGVASNFLGSDTDIMVIAAGTRVIEGDSFSPHDPDHIFQTVMSRHPAFVRLKLLHMGNTLNRRIFPTPELCVVDETGNLVLHGTALKEILTFPGGNFNVDSTVHGPAHTTSLRIAPENEFDIVWSLHCESWPSAANEWISRQRRNNWPTPDLINDVTEQGCELVAIGNPESEGKELEWRISSSLAERMLIRSLNIVQIQCYFLLKLILSYLIKPCVKDGPSSYHMKNIMLHVAENTDPREWREDNLTLCFMTCLQTLLLNLEMGHLPQYFILSHNLLRPKIQGVTHRKIQDIIRELCSEGWRCLLRCAPFTNVDLPCSHYVARCPCFIQLWKDKALHQIGRNGEMSLRALFQSGQLLVHSHTTADFNETLRNLFTVINFQESTKQPYFPSPSSALLIRKLLRCHIGYMLLYVTRRHHASGNRTVWQIMKVCKRLLHDNCDVDMTSCRLKLATFYYQTGQIHKCIQTVVNVLIQYHAVDTLPRCVETDRVLRYKGHPRIVSALKRLHNMYSNIPGLIGHMAFSVTFSPWEILSAPPAVQELMSVCMDREYFKLLHIDPLVYGYFLLIASLSEQGNLDDARRSMDNMRRVVRDPWTHILFYPETAQHLLDYCESHYRMQSVTTIITSKNTSRCSSGHLF